MWTTTWGDEAAEGVDDDYWHGIKTREGGREKKGEGGWEGGRKRYLCVVVYLGGREVGEKM